MYHADVSFSYAKVLEIKNAKFISAEFIVNEM